jgi:hypothetical protein
MRSAPPDAGVPMNPVAERVQVEEIPTPYASSLGILPQPLGYRGKFGVTAGAY